MNQEVLHFLKRALKEDYDPLLYAIRSAKRIEKAAEFTNEKGSVFFDADTLEQAARLHLGVAPYVYPKLKQVDTRGSERPILLFDMRGMRPNSDAEVRIAPERADDLYSDFVRLGDREASTALDDLL